MHTQIKNGLELRFQPVFDCADAHCFLRSAAAVYSDTAAADGDYRTKTAEPERVLPRDVGSENAAEVIYTTPLSRMPRRFAQFPAASGSLFQRYTERLCPRTPYPCAENIFEKPLDSPPYRSDTIIVQREDLRKGARRCIKSESFPACAVCR